MQARRGRLAAVWGAVMVLVALASLGCGAKAEPAVGVVRGVVVRPLAQDPRSGAVGASGATVPVNGDPVRARDAAGRTVAGRSRMAAAFLTHSAATASRSAPPAPP